MSIPVVKEAVRTEGVKRTRHRPLSTRDWLLSIVAYIIAAVFLVPYLEMIVTAVSPTNQLGTSRLFPSRIDFSNFTSLWSLGLGTNLGVSLEVAIGATILVTAVALPAAYYTARKKFRGRMFFLVLVLITQMFQPTALLVGIYAEFSHLGLTDSVFGLVIVNSAFNLAFATWIMTAYISSIPVELEEAAFVDGTTRFGALRRITLPLALPGIVTAMIFTFIAAWNELVVALMLTTTPSHQPLTVALDGFIGGYQIDWGHLFATSVISTIPVIILFAFIEGRVVGGLTAGSLK
ncbi:MAG: carbohydrate ABC transporter permease [Acidimicrobiaceae bacterium]|nr:carbohydrate ABC transporter permease [Acidimicrobiaceae bacterium]